LYYGKVGIFEAQMHKDQHYAMDFEISADLAQRAMTGKDRDGTAPKSAVEQLRKVFEKGINWLERYEKTTDTIFLRAPPVPFLAFMDTLEREGIRFEFDGRATVSTGGGWKTRENERLSSEDFRKRVQEMLGIPETRCIDQYGMVEMNAGGVTCPEGHYYHLPYTFFKPLVLDKSLTPTGYDEWGRFAFLDAIAGSYPGFIISGDEVRMLEHCPICDLPGPVLDKVIQRASSEEVRGCAEEVRRILELDLKGVKK
jgi:hypothetical protein